MNHIFSFVFSFWVKKNDFCIFLSAGPDQVPTQIGAPGTVDPLDVPYGAAESGETNTTGKVSAPVAPASAAQVSGRDWHLGASYAVGDVCTYQGQSYQCRQAHHVVRCFFTRETLINQSIDQSVLQDSPVQSINQRTMHGSSPVEHI